MKGYQEKYIQNLKRIFELNAMPGEIPQDAAAYAEQRMERGLAVRRIAGENTALLRAELFPLLDDIATASREDVESLEEFAAGLNEGGAYLDLALCHKLYEALVTYARHWRLRDLLIRSLYNQAMALFYMQEILNRTGRSNFRWKMNLLFGEAASYLKQYDEIDNMDTRGYIHRAMGNLALAYSDLDPESGRKKLSAIRRSLRILQDPVYHEKSPSLPWALYLSKTHQERTTALGLLRAGIVDPQVQREVMESAEYVLDQQKELSRQRGGSPPMRWRYAYEAAQYHCGVRPLGYLLNWLEKVYLERDPADYTHEGMYCNMFLPALYASYLAKSPEMSRSKKLVLGLMYRQLAAYVRKMPDNQLSEATLNNLLACLQSFVEYPDGIQEKDFIITLAVCRSPDTFVASYMAAQVARMLVGRVLEDCPQALSGTLGYIESQDLCAHRQELETFAYEACLLHNVGVLAFSNLLRRAGRGRLEVEEEMYRCHVYAGQTLLDQSESTRPYAQAALGHHRFFNGKGGYPSEYSRSEDPNVLMTDLVSTVIHFIHLLGVTPSLSREPLPLEQALAEVRAEAGARLNPAFCGPLLTLEPELREYLQDGRAKAYEKAFELIKG